jgi:acetyl-CoA acetyltransferase
VKDIVIVDGARTPMAEYNGHFSDISAIDLGVIAAKEALARSGFAPRNRPRHRRQRAADLG